MIKKIDNFLDRITMYRLMLSYLIFLSGAAIILGAFNLISYSPLGIFYTILVITLSALLFNKIFSYIFKVPANVESVYITALILSLIITPPKVGEFLVIVPFFILVSFISVASKFLLNVGKKHIFNPAAISVFLTIYLINQTASWWVGTLYMAPLILLGGLLMVRKLKQFHLVIPFILISLGINLVITYSSQNISQILFIAFTYSPLLFFAFVMLTEPLTSPHTRKGRIVYGILIAVLFNPQLHVGSFYFGQEVALLVGNIFAFIISPKGRFIFVVKEVKEISSGVLDFSLEANKKINFKAGQYMEWTVNGKNADNRGNRRYFTLASSPTENVSRLGIRFYPNPSSFKKIISLLKPGDKIFGGHLSGEFVLPENKHMKLAFLAGGIGVTPFRSMTKYLIDTNEKRDAVMIYSNRTEEEIAYKDIFDQAEQVGVKTIYTLTEKDLLPSGWTGETGFIDQQMIERQIPDFRERLFYISGSHSMVTAFKEMLQKMGVSKSQIKTDFFPGLV